MKMTVKVGQSITVLNCSVAIIKLGLKLFDCCLFSTLTEENKSNIKCVDYLVKMFLK